MTRHLSLCLMLVAALAGCGSLPGPAPTPQIYLLQMPETKAAAGQTVPWQLSVALPMAPDALDTGRIALTRDGVLDYYADAAWTDHTTKLLQTKLVEALENSGKIAGVAAEDEALKSDYRLTWNVRAFQAEYAADGPPQVALRVAVKLVTAPEREVIGAAEFSRQAPAAANNMPAIVAAFGEATGGVMADIANWVLTLPAAAAVADAPAPVKTNGRKHHRRHSRSR